MDSADKASGDGYTDLARHDAYLANQIACVAEQTGKEHAALDLIAQGASERQQIQLEAANREAGAVRAHAQRSEQRAQEAEANANQAATTTQGMQTDQGLQSELAGLNAQQTDRGLVLNFGDEVFETDQALLKPGVNHALDQLAHFLNAHPERRLLAEGHSVSAAAIDNNPDLSARRASALKDALLQRGISRDRIEVAGAGNNGSLASNDNAAGGQPVHWVEVIISDQSGNVASRIIRASRSIRHPVLIWCVAQSCFSMALSARRGLRYN